MRELENEGVPEGVPDLARYDIDNETDHANGVCPQNVPQRYERNNLAEILFFYLLSSYPPIASNPLLALCASSRAIII